MVSSAKIFAAEYLWSSELTLRDLTDMTSTHYAFNTFHKPIVAGLELPGEEGTMAVDTSAPSTLFLWYLIFIATVGPLQFGYHLVSHSLLPRLPTAT
jgi:hypothetical protein